MQMGIQLWTPMRLLVHNIYFDTTGPQRPNKFGMDAFRLVVLPDKVYYGTFKPAGTESLRSIVMYGKLTYTKYKVGEKLEF